MNKHWQYFKYICRHKWFVFRFGLLTKVPLWNLIVHDFSKFLPDEWFPYAEQFYGSGTKDNPIPAFAFAWLHHQRRNKHHWQYWYLIQDVDPSIALLMPENYAREMVADWAGAGFAITGKLSLRSWYSKNREIIKLHPETRLFVETLISKIDPEMPS